MNCNRWQRRKKGFVGEVLAWCRPQKTLNKEEKFFAAGVWGIQHSTRRKRWSGFSQISRKKSGLVENCGKGKLNPISNGFSCCTNRFTLQKHSSHLHSFYLDPDQSKLRLIGFKIKFLGIGLAPHSFLGSILYFNQRLFPGEMCFPIFFHLLEKCF